MATTFASPLQASSSPQQPTASPIEQVSAKTLKYRRKRAAKQRSKQRKRADEEVMLDQQRNQRRFLDKQAMQLQQFYDQQLAERQRFQDQQRATQQRQLSYHHQAMLPPFDSSARPSSQSSVHMQHPEQQPQSAARRYAMLQQELLQMEHQMQQESPPRADPYSSQRLPSADGSVRQSPSAPIPYGYSPPSAPARAPPVPSTQSRYQYHRNDMQSSEQNFYFQQDFQPMPPVFQHMQGRASSTSQFERPASQMSLDNPVHPQQLPPHLQRYAPPSDIRHQLQQQLAREPQLSPQAPAQPPPYQ